MAPFKVKVELREEIVEPGSLSKRKKANFNIRSGNKVRKGEHLSPICSLSRPDLTVPLGEEAMTRWVEIKRRPSLIKNRSDVSELSQPGTLFRLR